MRRVCALLAGPFLCCAAASCSPAGVEISLGQLVEDSITTDDEYVGWNQGSYYKTYNIELDETTYRIKFWSDGFAVLCSQHDDHDTLGSHDHDVSMSTTRRWAPGTRRTSGL